MPPPPRAPGPADRPLPSSPPRDVHNWDFRTFDDFQQRATVEDWTDMDQVTTFFEMMGVMYSRGVAELSLLDDLLAGSVVLMWSRLSSLIHGYRQWANVHDYGLRFELLAKALDQCLTARRQPHVALP